MTTSRIGGRGRRPDPPARPELARLERALESLFRLGANRRFEAHQAELVGAEVTRAGYAVLRSLHDLGTLTVRQVAEACWMDAATASRQISQLVDGGLVQRRTNAADSRSAAVELTEPGREVYAAIVDYRLRVLASVVDDWGTDEQLTMAGLVERLAGSLAERLPER